MVYHGVSGFSVRLRLKAYSVALRGALEGKLRAPGVARSLCERFGEQ